jgi:hypothetical protein
MAVSCHETFKSKDHDALSRVEEVLGAHADVETEIKTCSFDERGRWTQEMVALLNFCQHARHATGYIISPGQPSRPMTFIRYPGCVFWHRSRTVDPSDPAQHLAYMHLFDSVGTSQIGSPKKHVQEEPHRDCCIRIALFGAKVHSGDYHLPAIA